MFSHVSCLATELINLVSAALSSINMPRDSTTWRHMAILLANFPIEDFPKGDNDNLFADI